MNALFSMLSSITAGHSKSQPVKASLLNTLNMGALLAASASHPAGWVLAGFLAGCSVHLRPTALLLVPILALWLWLWRRSKRKLPALLFFGVGLLLALVPVAARNYHIGGEWVWTTAHGGMNFCAGNSPESNGPYEMLSFAHTDTASEQEAFLKEARRRSGQDLTPVQASDFWYAESLRFIRKEPMREVSLLLKKALIFFNGYEAPINMGYNFLRREFGSILTLPFMSFALLLPLAVLGVAQAVPHFLLVGYLMGVFSSNILFLVSSEYRFPVVPVLCLYAGHALCIFARDIRERSGEKLLVAGGILALLIVFTTFDI